MKSFSYFHPIVLIIYFAGIIGVSMFSMNPVMSLTAIAGGLIFKLMYIKPSQVIRDIIFYLIFAAVVCVTNPIFSHNGKTVLFFVGDMPVTMESVIYGGCGALMIISALCWFGCFGYVMTSDKIVYLFSGAAPTLGLVLSSALKFIPTMIRKYREIYNVQKRLSSEKQKKFLIAMRSFSALITWSIEHTADTAASMNSRGYGLKGRSSFSLYRFKISDFVFMIICLFMYSFVFFMIKLGETKFIFYPEIVYPKRSIGYVAFSFVWILMVMLPAFIEIRGEFKWKSSEPKT